MVTTTKYIWDDDNIIAEADETDTIHTVYTYEPQQHGNLISTRIGNATSYHHFDATGSTRQLTNAVGGVTDRMTYDAWGNVVSRTGTTPIAMLWIGEVGYYYDMETGSFSVRERPYEPENGRWTTVDPLEFIDALNRYLYAQNAPLTHFDPSGLKVCWDAPDKVKPDCGKFSWLGKFGGIEKPDKLAWLIQKVTTTFSVINCATGNNQWASVKCVVDPGPHGTDAANAKPETLEYWEMWLVNAFGQVVLVNILGTPSIIKPGPDVPKGEDPWNATKAGEGTKGSYSTEATLYLVPVQKFLPPGGWEFWHQNPQQQANILPGGLPYCCDTPDFDKKATKVATRSLKYKWNCCPCEEKFDGPVQVAVDPKC